MKCLYPTNLIPATPPFSRDDSTELVEVPKGSDPPDASGL
jgi:hypothetical protein